MDFIIVKNIKEKENGNYNGPQLHMMTIRVDLISNLSNLRQEQGLKTYIQAVLY